MKMPIRKIRFRTLDSLLKNRFYLFNNELIVSQDIYNRLDKEVLLALKLQGNYFVVEDRDESKK